MSRMNVNLAGVELKNPVMTASGTFGSGAEYSEFVDLNRLGAVVTKGVANVPWPGNATPRVAETYGGMMNAYSSYGSDGSDSSGDGSSSSGSTGTGTAAGAATRGATAGGAAGGAYSPISLSAK